MSIAARTANELSESRYVTNIYVKAMILTGFISNSFGMHTKLFSVEYAI